MLDCTAARRSASSVAMLGAAWQQVRTGAEAVLGRKRIAALMLF